MKVTKIRTDNILSDKDMKCLKTYNESQRRQFLASKADSIGCHNVSIICNEAGICRDTLYRGLYELESDYNALFPNGSIRTVGGGRKPILMKTPHLLDIFDEITSTYTAGLPQMELQNHITLTFKVLPMG
ncbi:hypothetical protein [Bacteroides sp. HPS0048]|uniref:hypothetical protein n=1 Tax=Bacteroides sp. HPS0048 TaxID=1078089 RepID=UPI0005C7686E|nr:hypothetical protein [Bacteroides sp. HPS0048]